MTRTEILSKAKETVCTDRNSQYGEPEDNFSLIAEYWSVYTGKKIQAKDVAIMMCLLKIARMRSGKKDDNYIDGIGYLACGAEIEDTEKGGRVGWES